MTTSAPKLRTAIAATFTVEPIATSLAWWQEHLGWTPAIQFAPYNQVFQQLLDPSSLLGGNRDGANVLLVRLEDWTRRIGGKETARSSTSPFPAGVATFILPNGCEVAHLNRYETEYVYREIFRDRVYLKHGITIEDGDCVIDVGANIGLFTLFVSEHAPNARVFACEPAPAAFEALSHNTERHAGVAVALNCGIGDVDQRASFTCYSKSSVFSTFHADAKEDRQAIRAVVRNVLRETADVATEALDELTDSLIADRLESQQVEVQMRTLSSLIREHGIDRVDLLKIDAEKSELAVLRGIADEDWPRIQQLVIEVHDPTGTVLQEVRAILDHRGFQVTAVEGEPLLETSGLCNVYASQRSAPRRSGRGAAPISDELTRTASDFAEALRASASRTPVPHIVVLCPPSPSFCADATLLAATQNIERQLADDLGDVPGLSIVTSTALAALYPVADEYDARADAWGHIPYTPLAFAALGTQVARAIHAALRPPAKVVVVDCDQTLWGGVCAEDGPAGVRIEERHRILQRFLVEQHQWGRLVCLCSKNDEADVLSVFSERPDFDLTLSHLTTWRVNWQAKSRNLLALAEQLGLGLESFVFLDDNPIECAEVQGACPEVVTIQIPNGPDGVGHVLRHIWSLDRRQTTTPEDRQRSSLYRQNVERSRWRDRAMTYDAFIAGLELDVRIAPLTAAGLGRAAQLTERTNQFNFTTVRRSEAQLKALWNRGPLELLTVHVRDRFGDDGFVGLAGFVAVDDALRVETFLLSCRVLGKGVEHQVLERLGVIAMERGLRVVELPFVPTRRNTPALKFAESLEHADRRQQDVGFLFVLSATAAADVRFNAARATGLGGEMSEATTSLDPVPPTDAAFLARIPHECATAAQVLAQLGDLDASAGATRRAQTPLEERLRQIWCECLGQVVGPDDNYFDRGGDSIIAVQIASRAHAEGLYFTPKDVLEHQTVEALAAFVTVAGEQDGRAPGLATAQQAPAHADLAPSTTLPDDLAPRHPTLEDSYPLTPMQMMFYAQASSALTTGFEQWRFRLDGPLSLAAYRRAWEHVVARHPALRTAFETDALGQPCQVVLNRVGLPWQEEDLRGLSGAQQQERVHAYMAHDRVSRFDVARAPLMRIAIFCLGPGVFEVVWTFHHLVVDGWSCSVILGDVARAYRTLEDGGEIVSDASAPFRRLVEWQAAATERSLEFWRGALAGVTTPTPLPREGVWTDPSAGRSVREWHLSIAEDTSARLVARARAERVTVPTLLQAAWALVLAHMSGQDDIIFGVTMSGRPPEIVGVEEMVGTFVNNVPIRVIVDRTVTVDRFLRDFQQRTAQAAEHQYVALSRIQAVSDVPSRHRLFDSLVVVQNYLGAERGARNWALSNDTHLDLLSAPVRTGYPLTLVVVPGAALAVTLVIHEGTIRASIAEDVLRGFDTLVRALCDSENRSVHDLLTMLPRVSMPPVEHGLAPRSGVHTNPRTDLEREIVAVWQLAFQHTAFGIDANFFDLGGHSLLMLEVHDALQKRLGRQISLVDLFEYPTIAGLAAHLSGSRNDASLRTARNRAQRQRDALAQQRRPGGTARATR